MATARPRTAAARPSGLRAYLRRTNLLTSLVLILPPLILYQLGVLIWPDQVGNGADLITGPVFRVLNHWHVNFLFFDLGLLLLFGVLVGFARRHERFDVRMFVPVMLESGVYALSMGAVIVYLMQLIGISPQLSSNALGHAQPGVLGRIALSLGAGVNEELVFRLAMIPALVGLFEKAGGLRRWLALGAAFVLSSLLFSAAHHVIGGEPWHLAPFVYRFFCGLIFASLFQFRGLAVAVYTHALYDVYVMLFHG